MAKIDQARSLTEANITRFRELLSAPTDAFQRKQLKWLLAREKEISKALAAKRPSRRSMI